MVSRRHGLSYGAPYEYSDLKVVGSTISFMIERSEAGGSSGGCDTPQVYLGFPGAHKDARKPTKVLRYFEKTCEAKASFSFTLSDADVSNWDPDVHTWAVTQGTYEVLVGASSRDIRLKGELVV